MNIYLSYYLLELYENENKHPPIPIREKKEIKKNKFFFVIL